jgi:hypothetical protein
MVFSLLPSSSKFPSGGRDRVTVAFADARNFDAPVLSPPPVLQIPRDREHPSYIELPVLGER